VILLVLLAATTVFAVIARAASLPYPIVFALGGALLALVPTIPAPRIAPDLIFTVVLPPLLFAGGWTTDWTEFRRNLRPITLLAFGLVIATTLAVAAVAHAIIPGFPWAAAFALGAIVSPPDAVAAGAVFERFNVPRRVVAILDGEGLLNDATALVIYRFAVVAAATQTFSLAHAAASFVWVAAGGVAIGLGIVLAVDAGASVLSKLALNDTLVDNLLLLLTPYAAYLSADALGLSGVLSTVTAGVYLSRRSSVAFTPESRLVASAVWDLLTFAFNGFLFMTIGLVLRSISHELPFTAQAWRAAAVISLAVIAVRFAWVFPATWLPRKLSRKLAERDPMPPWRWVFVIAWSGMRGTISLAAALALPYAAGGGRPFPGRGEIILITFAVIFATLIVQGTSLIYLIKRLGLDDGESLRAREVEVRIRALRAGLAGLHELEDRFTSEVEWEVAGRLFAEYEYRIEHLLGHGNGNAETSAVSRLDHRFEGAALDAERREVHRLRNIGEIPDEVFRKIQYDLDLAASRLR
jgi:CPA1 family monovalent cation:H+ antiporter